MKKMIFFSFLQVNQSDVWHRKPNTERRPFTWRPSRWWWRFIVWLTPQQRSRDRISCKEWSLNPHGTNGNAVPPVIRDSTNSLGKNYIGGNLHQLYLGFPLLFLVMGVDCSVGVLCHRVVLWSQEVYSVTHCGFFW